MGHESRLFSQSKTSCSHIGNVYLVANCRESHSGKGVKSNLACKGCNLCLKGESQQHHSQTEICSVRVGGSLYPSMLTLLSSASSQDLPDWWPSDFLNYAYTDFLLLKLGISMEQLFSLQLTTLVSRKKKNRKKILNFVSIHIFMNSYTYPFLSLSDI